MSGASARRLPLAAERCWSSVGVQGDRSCPELAAVHHCHHCTVFAEAARGLLDRAVPQDYQLPAGGLATEATRETRAQGTVSVLVFELGGEVFAIDVAHVVEAVEARPAHRVTRRSGEIFRGLVNVRGQLELYASLSSLLGVGSEPELRADKTRMVVLARDGQRWVVAVQRLVGVRRYAESALRSPPATLALGGAHVRRVVRDEAWTVALLDPEALFARLAGCLP
jgi:chemotaxis-related protein WspD